MIKKLIANTKKKIFRKILRHYDSITMFWYVMAIVSIRWDFVYVKKLRDGQSGNVRLCDVVIKRKWKDFRLTDVRLLDFFRK